jgi:hypothetical protein
VIRSRFAYACPCQKIGVHFSVKRVKENDHARCIDHLLQTPRCKTHASDAAAALRDQLKLTVDTGHWAAHYPKTLMVILGGRSIYVRHDVQTLQRDPASNGVESSFAATRIDPGSRLFAGDFISIQEALGRGRFNLRITVANRRRS